MSYTTLLGVKTNGDVDGLTEYRNGHGSGPYVWNAIFQPRGIEYLFAHPNQSPISSKFLPNLAIDEAWVLAMTFDGCIIDREVASVAAKHLREFIDRTKEQWKDRVNHWPKILAVIESLPDGYDGIAINHTSVYDAPMLAGHYDEEADESTPYNVKRDEGHFYLREATMREWMTERAKRR